MQKVYIVKGEIFTFNNERLKEIRLKKGYTLDHLCQKTGFTKGFLSLLERGLRKPSLESLRKISDCLDIPIITFFIEKNQAPIIENKNDNNGMFNIIRRNNRMKIIIPEILTEYEFVTPYSVDDDTFPEIIGTCTELAPGCWTSEKMVVHDTDESIYVIKGNMKGFINEFEFELEEGDSIFIKKNSPHNSYNCGQETLITLNYMIKK